MIDIQTHVNISSKEPTESKDVTEPAMLYSDNTTQFGSKENRVAKLKMLFSPSKASCKVMTLITTIFVCIYADVMLLYSLNFCKRGDTEYCITEMPVQFTQAVFDLFIYQFLITLLLFLAGRLADFTGGCLRCRTKNKTEKQQQKVLFFCFYLFLDLNLFRKVIKFKEVKKATMKS